MLRFNRSFGTASNAASWSTAKIPPHTCPICKAKRVMFAEIESKPSWSPRVNRLVKDLQQVPEVEVRISWTDLSWFKITVRLDNYGFQQD